MSIVLFAFFAISFSPIDSYDFFKSTLLRNPIPLVDYQFRDGFFLHVVASLAAGTCGTSKSLAIRAPGATDRFMVEAVCSPADVIRTRIMSSVSTCPVILMVKFDVFLVWKGPANRGPGPFLA